MMRNKYISAGLLATVAIGGMFLTAEPLHAIEQMKSPPYVPPPPPPAGEDVAKLLYDVNHSLIKQSGIIQGTHTAVVDAHEDYINDPNASTYRALLRATQRDEAAVKKYSDLVAQSQRIEKQIQEDKKEYYEETPATLPEIETGPAGESVLHEIPEPPPVIVSQLKAEIKSHKPSFKEQLEAQTKMLKKVDERVAKEEASPAVQSNPEARKEDVDLRSALEKAINARRKALGEDR